MDGVDECFGLEGVTKIIGVEAGVSRSVNAGTGEMTGCIKVLLAGVASKTELTPEEIAVDSTTRLSVKGIERHHGP